MREIVTEPQFEYSFRIQRPRRSEGMNGFFDLNVPLDSKEISYWYASSNLSQLLLAGNHFFIWTILHDDVYVIEKWTLPYFDDDYYCIYGYPDGVANL